MPPEIWANVVAGLALAVSVFALWKSWLQGNKSHDLSEKALELQRESASNAEKEQLGERWAAAILDYKSHLRRFSHVGGRVEPSGYVSLKFPLEEASDRVSQIARPTPNLFYWFGMHSSLVNVLALTLFSQTGAEQSEEDDDDSERKRWEEQRAVFVRYCREFGANLDVAALRGPSDSLGLALPKVYEQMSHELEKAFPVVSYDGPVSSEREEQDNQPE